MNDLACAPAYIRPKPHMPIDWWQPLGNLRYLEKMCISGLVAKRCLLKSVPKRVLHWNLLVISLVARQVAANQFLGLYDFRWPEKADWCTRGPHLAFKPLYKPKAHEHTLSMIPPFQKMSEVIILVMTSSRFSNCEKSWSRSTNDEDCLHGRVLHIFTSKLNLMFKNHPLHVNPFIMLCKQNFLS